ncbi:MAG: sensor histidine kinase [Clostridia bacterium]|nr:sensor histidine kinase [Clostridia bacterium]
MKILKTNLKLRSKFILSFLVLVLLPCIFFNITLYLRTENAIREKVYLPILRDLAEVGNNLNSRIQSLDTSLALMFADKDLIQNCKNAAEDSGKGIEAPNISYKTSNMQTNIIANMININSDLLKSMYFIDREKVYLLHPHSIAFRTENSYKKDLWYQDLLMKNSDTPFFGAVRNAEDDTYAISAIKTYRSMDTKGEPWLFRFDLDPDRIKQLVNATDNYILSNHGVFIADSYGVLLSKGNNDPIHEKWLTDFLKRKDLASSGFTIFTASGTEKCLIYYTSPQTKWKIMSVVPVDEIFGELKLFRNTIILLTSLCLVLLLIFTIVIPSVLLKPIHHLNKAMLQLKKGDFSTRVEVKGHDETRLLSETFNNMAENMEQMINKVYNAQIKQKDAELKALKSQINPHFLYNTLECMRGSALEHGITDMASAAGSLSNLFRFSISGGDFTDLRSEIQYLSDYMTIQNFRHDNKFRVQYSIPEELYDYSIMKLTLQPLIENSIKHGLEMKFGRGTITIEAFREEDRIQIRVSDDGTGIPLSRLKMLNEVFDGKLDPDVLGVEGSERGVGIGLLNVNQRLKILFGEHFGLRFSESTEGTTVIVSIPAVRWKGEDRDD